MRTFFFIFSLLCFHFYVTFSQSCCNISVVSVGSTENNAIKTHNLQVGLSYSYINSSAAYQFDKKVQDPLQRTAFGRNLIFDLEYGILDKFSLYFLIPYSSYHRSQRISEQLPIIEYKNSGFGDLLFLLKYDILSPRFSLPISISAGFGIKFPTGSFDASINGTMLPFDVQTGTGSFDFPFWALIKFTPYEKISLTQSLMFKLNGTNPQGNILGNELNSQTTLVWNLTEIFAPVVTIRVQKRWKDRIENQILPNSGRLLVEVIPNVIVNYQSFSVRLIFGIPAYTRVEGLQLSTILRLGLEMKYFIDFQQLLF
ncbi:MAG: transporter [Ignavibacteria bacterium]|nr:transporter [Ignavibacteria bacterium]